MKKLLLSMCMLLLLVGCQNEKTLDTSKLKKVQDEEKIKEYPSLPIDYEADSVKDVLKALPFKVVLPKDLPFGAKPFQTTLLQDVKHDGKIIRVEFTAFSKEVDEDNLQVIMVFATNQEKVELGGPTEKVALNNDIEAYISGDTLAFKKDTITYHISLTLKDGANLKEELIKLANQM
ncbi:MAG: hypothetical protein ACI35O_10805 [Bacillaceae bacterium]